MKYISYLFLFSILFSLFVKLEVCVNYFINQNYYAEVLCENKDKEDSCCKGKCAMEKELEKLNSNEEPQPVKNSNALLKLSKVEEALISQLEFFIYTLYSPKIKIDYSANLKVGIKSPLFKPPRS